MKDILQSNSSFAAKWESNPNLARRITLETDSEIFKWILNRNGFQNVDDLKSWLENKDSILDAGCGNGRVTALLAQYSPENSSVTGIDINCEVAKDHFKDDLKIEILEANISEPLEIGREFDLIYCQEVLHHTINPQESFNNLCKLLKNGGEIAIYVYKLKAPIREFTDEYVRAKLQNKSYLDSEFHMKQIAEFGRALSSYDIKLAVPAVDILEIKGGEFDLQRLIYHFFFKCFWNEALTLKENIAINTDWYHPSVASKHTLPEVLQWFKQCDLEVIHQCEDEYGITIRGKSKF